MIFFFTLVPSLKELVHELAVKDHLNDHLDKSKIILRKPVASGNLVTH